MPTSSLDRTWIECPSPGCEEFLYRDADRRRILRCSMHGPMRIDESEKAALVRRELNDLERQLGGAGDGLRVCFLLSGLILGGALGATLAHGEYLSAFWIVLCLLALGGLYSFSDLGRGR